MMHFTKLADVDDPASLLQKAMEFKKAPLSQSQLGQGKTLILVFFNPSLRTRISTEKAAINLGLSCIVYNASQGWKLEFEENMVMNTDRAEHIKEAAAVISQYADIIGIRTFPSLTDQEKDYSDFVLNQFIEHTSVPIVSLESAIRHPLQSLADWLTIEELKKVERPKVVLSWAPHPKSLPQAVANSFSEWMNFANVDLTITHPEGYELADEFIGNAKIEYDQHKAFEGADFIYTKNWSSYKAYGQQLQVKDDWVINSNKMAKTNNAYFMHCLPVRRNVVVTDQVIESPNSVVIQQAQNRLFAAQAVLNSLLV
ncbi:MAG: N-acetylornithine carbamoyltransferase [Bacteroidota bacterium]